MLRRLSLLFLTTMPLGACYSWHPSPIAPRTLIEVEQPDVVRVRTSAGRESVLLHPIIRRDSISETGTLCTNGRCVERTSTVALFDVQEVDTRGFNAVRTVGASLLSLLGALTFAVVVSGGVLGSGPF